jgi:hypothetical protein
MSIEEAMQLADYASPLPHVAGRALKTLRAEVQRLDGLLNHPELHSFARGVVLEGAHQIARWGTVHDRAKDPQDWYWLVGYLAGKALRAHADGDTEKALHHTISTAAALGNWHAHIRLGVGPMQPGSSDLQVFLEETFGPAALEGITATESQSA